MTITPGRLRNRLCQERLALTQPNPVNQNKLAGRSARYAPSYRYVSRIQVFSAMTLLSSARDFVTLIGPMLLSLTVVSVPVHRR